MKVCFRANTWLILLLFIVIVALTLFSSSSGDLTRKSAEFASAQTQTSDATIDLRGILGTPLYHSNNAKITALRVIDVGEVPKTEVSIIEKGTMVGIGNVTNIATFIEIYKTNKIVFSEGKGMITAGNGIAGDDTITWTSHDIGKINSDKSENYHGIMFFLGGNNTSSIGKLGFLSNTAALYTTSVANNGTTLRQIWQWK
ncbi:MAG TPA: hypothetical protein VFI70_08060 [Nitrososphaeraceae archaeon]|nr:hypothetical protein [Nitrososphaeraceae archaeon]